MEKSVEKKISTAEIWWQNLRQNFKEKFSIGFFDFIAII